MLLPAPVRVPVFETANESRRVRGIDLLGHLARGGASVQANRAKANCFCHWRRRLGAIPVDYRSDVVQVGFSVVQRPPKLDLRHARLDARVHHRN